MNVRLAAISAVLMGAVTPICAQVGPRIPFVGRGVTAFDPEIGVLNSGAVLDAQPVVSSDLKYVTITVRGQNSRVTAIREFTFQRIAPQAELGGGGGILAQEGVTRLGERSPRQSREGR
jgi:hypothetical protein